MKKENKVYILVMDRKTPDTVRCKTILGAFTDCNRALGNMYSGFYNSCSAAKRSKYGFEKEYRYVIGEWEAGYRSIEAPSDDFQLYSVIPQNVE